MSTPATTRPDYIGLVKEVRGYFEDEASDRRRIARERAEAEQRANEIRAQRIREQLCTMCHDLGYECLECAMNRAEYYGNR